MKKPLVVLLFLLTVLTFVSAPKVSATTTEDLHTTPGLPDEVPREPMPENSTVEDYLNTTNPYADIDSQGVVEELDDAEGDKPLYVIVFGDEEERDIIRMVGPIIHSYDWDGWAEFQIERGDEALVANFGIDIRILGFEDWDSDDSKNTMTDLWYELESDTEQYLGQWYNGEWWSNYVDAVIGITSQGTPADPLPIAGKAPGSEYVNQGRIFILLRWQVYWADDNLVQHEVSHLFYAPDHYVDCCPMAYHTHFRWYIWEDGLWIVLADVECGDTSYSWCDDCYQAIHENRYKYLAGNQPPDPPSTPSGPDGIDPPCYVDIYYSFGFKAIDPDDDDVRCYIDWGDGKYQYSSWFESGEPFAYNHKYSTTGWKYIKVKAQDEDTELWSPWSTSHAVKISYGGGGGDPCPTLFAWNGEDYINYGVIDIHDPTGEDIIREIPIQEEDVYIDNYKGTFLLEEGWEGLEFSESDIDQVKLYALIDGNQYLCPLIKAMYEETENVLLKLWFSDDWKCNIKLLEIIDLKFLVPYSNVEDYVFVLEGNNMLKP